MLNLVHTSAFKIVQKFIIEDINFWIYVIMIVLVNMEIWISEADPKNLGGGLADIGGGFPSPRRKIFSGNMRGTCRDQLLPSLAPRGVSLEVILWQVNHCTIL